MKRARVLSIRRARYGGPPCDLCSRPCFVAAQVSREGVSEGPRHLRVCSVCVRRLARATAPRGAA